MNNDSMYSQIYNEIAEAMGAGRMLVESGETAYAKIKAGASLVQTYAGFAYAGPAMIPRLKRDLAALLRRDGVARLADAVGAEA